MNLAKNIGFLRGWILVHGISAAVSLALADTLRNQTGNWGSSIHLIYRLPGFLPVYSLPLLGVYLMAFFGRPRPIVLSTILPLSLAWQFLTSGVLQPMFQLGCLDPEGFHLPHGFLSWAYGGTLFWGYFYLKGKNSTVEEISDRAFDWQSASAGMLSALCVVEAGVYTAMGEETLPCMALGRGMTLDYFFGPAAAALLLFSAGYALIRFHRRPLLSLTILLAAAAMSPLALLLRFIFENKISSAS